MSQNLKVGDKAPEFKLPINGGGEVCSKDFIGKNLVVYFYPKDNTPGCTLETKDFRDYKPEFEKRTTEIIGVSKDSIKSHDKFADKYCLPFKLASDENSDMCEKFGVWKQKSFMGKKYMGIERSTFLIDKEGIIRKIWLNVSVTGHVKEVLAAVEAL
jgi:peroxiredoxin Q/BCP